MHKYWKILILILFTLGILLGLIQRNNLPDFSFGSNTTIKYFATPSEDSLAGYYQKSKEISESTSQPISKISFLAVGDIMLSRNVAGTIIKSGNINLPFGNIANLLKSTDFNFGNLESPVSPTKPIIGGHSLIFGTSEELLSGLKTYNFNVLNLANNHTLDQGLVGIKTTISTLDQLGIKHTGAGENLKDAWTPAIIERNGIKICFVGASYSSINDGGQVKNDYVARIDDIKNLKLQITNSKLLCDFVVATMHAGTEYTRTPNQAQKDFAHTAIDAGADMAIGAHPHWIQTIEKYNEKYIFYSLGNFIFDQEWSKETKEGLTLKIQISKEQTSNSLTPGAATMSDLQGPRTPAKVESIELIPIIIENYSTPRPATTEEAKKILQTIGEKDSLLK